MGNIFSRRKKKKKSRITETDNQILTLKFQRDQLIVFRRQLEFQYQQAEDAAKALLRNDRKAQALLALKRRKHQGELLHQAETQLLRVNTLISNVEVASMQLEVVKALESGNQALKAMQSETSVDYVAQLLDENSELQAQVTEIGQMLSATESEDPDLYQEYQKLEALVALDKASELPHVPSSSVPEALTSIDADNLTTRQDVMTSLASETDETPMEAAS